MMKSGLYTNGISDKEGSMLEKECSRNPELMQPSRKKEEWFNDCWKKGEDIKKFSMIFNKYNIGKLNLGKDDGKSDDGLGSKYTMIFNKDVKLREVSKKSEEMQPQLRTELNSMKLNDAETLMNLYGRSNLFIPELRITGLEYDENNNMESNNSKNSGGCRILKNKIASMTSLEIYSAREAPRRNVSSMQERKLSRVRSLDLCKSVSSSDSDLERTLSLRNGENSNGEESDRKSRGDAQKKRVKENRKQVQWKSEVDVIYFESHQAADGDRSGEIFGRVTEPLKEEWEQERTGFYAKMVPLPFGNHLNERWQSLLKI